MIKFSYAASLINTNTLWFCIGLLGQTLFSIRFIIQWLASEKQKKSVVPHMFWYFSLSGGLLLFCYAVHRQDPIFILGQGLGVFIYLRNLYFVLKNKASKNQSEQPDGSL